MKKIIWILLFGVMACGEDGEDSGTPDQLLLLSDREVVCPGQTVTFRLFSTASKSEVPITDFVFDPLPNGIGSISSNGVLTLGSVVSNSEQTISGTFRTKSKISSKIRIKSSSESIEPSLVITPFGFYNRDEGRPFNFWPDGSVLLGTEKNGPEPLKKFEVIKYSGQGVLEWKKDLGSGEAKFIEVRGQKIFAAGKLNELGGSVFIFVGVFDLDGKLVWEKKIPISAQHFLEGFQVDDLGNFFISTFTNGSSFVTKLEKYDGQGNKLWEVDPGTAYDKIFIFPDGNLAAKSEEGLGGEPFLTFFDASGKLLKKEKTEFISVSFDGPNDTFGVGYSVQNQSNQTNSSYVDLFNSVGQKIVTRQRILADQPFSGSLDNPIEKKSAPAGFEKFFTDKSGEVHVLHAGFWGYYDFLTLNSSSGKDWNWWKENKERTAEGVLYPLQILEEGNKLILLSESDGELYRFTLGTDYYFDDCLREPYWNKLDMF